MLPVIELSSYPRDNTRQRAFTLTLESITGRTVEFEVLKQMQLEKEKA